jgi:acyl carrier protein
MKPDDRRPTENSDTSQEVIERWLTTKMAETLKIDPRDIKLTEPFASYGVSSIVAVGFAGDLEEFLGVQLEPTLLWDYPTIESLAQYLAQSAVRKHDLGT